MYCKNVKLLSILSMYCKTVELSSISNYSCIEHGLKNGLKQVESAQYARQFSRNASSNVLHDPNMFQILCTRIYLTQINKLDPPL